MMYGLTNKEMLDFIINTSKQLGITAYDFGENTSLTASGAHNILTGASKNPRTKNLYIMFQYLEKKMLGKKLQYKNEDAPLLKLEEPSEEKQLEDIIASRIIKILEPKFNDIENRINNLEAKIK